MFMRERLYLIEDRSKAVYSSDRRGRHLLCKKGSELDDKEAEKYGLVDGRLSALKPAEEPLSKEKVYGKAKAKAKSKIIEPQAKRSKVIRIGHGSD